MKIRVLVLTMFLCVTALFCDGHSLQYLYTALSPSVHFPNFTAAVLLDEEQILHYDSNTKLLTQKAKWMKITKTEGMHLTQTLQGDQIELRQTLEKTMQSFNQTEGLHTLQRLFGCNTTNGASYSVCYDQFGYDGEDIISFNLSSCLWTAKSAIFKVILQELKLDKPLYTLGRKSFLENECAADLNEYIHDRDTLEKKDPPEVQVFQQQGSSSPELVCHATGFFPKGVMMSWQKDGEEVKETLPNQDGSFQKRIILRVPPEDLQKNKYTCVIQHSSLKKELRKELRVLDGRSRKEIKIIIITGTFFLAIVLIVVGVILKCKANPILTNQALTNPVMTNPALTNRTPDEPAYTAIPINGFESG